VIDTPAVRRSTHRRNDVDQINQPNRITRTIAIAVAGVTVGLATTYAVSGSGPDSEVGVTRRPTDQTAISDWATDRNMSGLSPASLTDARDPAATDAGATHQDTADTDDALRSQTIVQQSIDDALAAHREPADTTDTDDALRSQTIVQQSIDDALAAVTLGD
jgi:hypothetical protein